MSDTLFPTGPAMTTNNSTSEPFKSPQEYAADMADLGRRIAAIKPLPKGFPKQRLVRDELTGGMVWAWDRDELLYYFLARRLLGE